MKQQTKQRSNEKRKKKQYVIYLRTGKEQNALCLLSKVALKLLRITFIFQTLTPLPVKCKIMTKVTLYCHKNKGHKLICQ